MPDVPVKHFRGGTCSSACSSLSPPAGKLPLLLPSPLAAPAAASTVAQRLLFVGREEGKLLALRQLIGQGLRPPVLVFVSSKDRAKELHRCEAGRRCTPACGTLAPDCCQQACFAAHASLVKMSRHSTSPPQPAPPHRYEPESPPQHLNPPPPAQAGSSCMMVCMWIASTLTRARRHARQQWTTSGAG